MLEKIKNKINKIKKVISTDLFKMEVAFFIGTIIITLTNFLVNMFLGMYFLGSIFIVYSIFLYKITKGR